MISCVCYATPSDFDGGNEQAGPGALVPRGPARFSNLPPAAPPLETPMHRRLVISALPRAAAMATSAATAASRRSASASAHVGSASSAASTAHLASSAQSTWTCPWASDIGYRGTGYPPAAGDGLFNSRDGRAWQLAAVPISDAGDAIPGM